MPPPLDHLPRVSFIMPTLNAEALLDNVLASIARQTYPREKMEIILADAHSTDRTRAIAQKYGALVLDDDGQNMEEGKRLALRHATGEYIVFVDADNEFTHPDYLALAVPALAAHPQALGVESYYLPSPKMSSFCAYLTALLHISDPMAWLMSANPRLVARDGETERWTLPDNSLAYPLGANGFVYRRADLDKMLNGQNPEARSQKPESSNRQSANGVASSKLQVEGFQPSKPATFNLQPSTKKAIDNPLFQDTHVALFLMKNGQREWLRIRGRGVHHYYIQTLWKFVRKRRRATVHFLRVQNESKTGARREALGTEGSRREASGLGFSLAPDASSPAPVSRPAPVFDLNWMREKPPVPLWLAAVYCVTFAGPVYHTARGLLRDGDARWLWHLPACLASVLGNAWGVWTYRRRGRGENSKRLIAELQVKQHLKEKK